MNISILGFLESALTKPDSIRFAIFVTNVFPTVDKKHFVEYCYASKSSKRAVTRQHRDVTHKEHQ